MIINQVKQKLHLVGYLPIRYYKDAQYHEHKIYVCLLTTNNIHLSGKLDIYYFISYILHHAELKNM